MLSNLYYLLRTFASFGVLMRLKLTNKLGLPEPVVEAIRNDPYNSGDSDYTPSSLVEPPRAAELGRLHEIVQDASELLASLDGQIAHLILERAAKTLEEQGYVVEKRFKGTYGLADKIFKVSAQVDLFDPVRGLISDYKRVRVSSLKHGLKWEHKFQLNMQAELVRRAGFQVDKLELVLMLKDWSAEIEYQGYPTSSMIKQAVPLMTSEEINKWVVERIVLHEAARLALPLCTQEERWERPTYAVMKYPAAQRDKAKRVFDTKEAAQAWIDIQPFHQGLDDPYLQIVERPGKSIRCLRYCPVRSVCEQGKTFQPKSEVDKDGFTKIT